MSIAEQLQHDLKEAMKAKDKLRVEVIRGARAALQRAQQQAHKERYEAAMRQIEQQYTDADAREQALQALELEPQPLDEETQQAVIAREVKQRRDSAQTYGNAGEVMRQEQEEAEARILEHYLPRQLSPEELRPQVAAVIAELGASSPAAMGKVMPVLVERFKGRADGRVLNQLARELLSQA